MPELFFFWNFIPLLRNVLRDIVFSARSLVITLLAIGVGAKILLSVTVNDSDMIKSFQVDLRIIKRFGSMMDDIWVWVGTFIN